MLPLLIADTAALDALSRLLLRSVNSSMPPTLLVSQLFRL